MIHRIYLALLAVSLVTVGIAEPMLAQSRAPESSGTPRFVSHTSLVLIPTVVTDHSGAHVSGLTKEDFTVQEDKRTEKISIFEEIKTKPGKIRRVDPNDAGFTNAVSPEAKTQRLTMIVLDTLNTRFEDQVRARREILKF